MVKDLNDASYDRQAIETYWRALWEADDLWDIDIDHVNPEEKFYNLVEFPYPSAEGLHVGHVYSYSGADTFSRYIRMRGKKIFQPMGFDSFGIHAENFALRTGIHPQELTSRTIEHYREQLKSMGAAWNWKHVVALTVATLLLPLLTLAAKALAPNSWNANPILLICVALVMLIAGVALACINIPAQTAMQEQTPEWIKGRVFALQLMLYNAFAIPIILFIGGIADLFGVDRVLYLLSICVLAFGAWGLYYERKHAIKSPPEPFNGKKEGEKVAEADTLSSKL